MGRARYKRLVDLYTRGTTIQLGDESYWLQAMNALEVDEARRNAQAARGRYIRAMKEYGSAEWDQLDGNLRIQPLGDVVKSIIDFQATKWLYEVQAEVEDDQDWKERLEILKVTDPDREDLPDEEKRLLEDLNREWAAEVAKRLEERVVAERKQFANMEADNVYDEYREIYLEATAGSRATDEFALWELFIGTRECIAEPDEDGEFTDKAHGKCDHRQRTFDNITEVRELPDGLMTALRTGFADIAMSARDARFSDRQESSSASSPLPSEEEESTPSTPTGTP